MQVLANIRYQKLQPIGVGQGMNSEVFLAYDPQLRGNIAVKEIEKRRLGNSVAEYFREAQMMFSVAHRNVVPVQYACETPQHICLAMRYFPQGSLADRIQAGPLSLGEVIRVGVGVLSGLARIHAAGLLHLDVKPSNVLFSDAGSPMVSDFGQSRAVAPTGAVNVPVMYRFAMPPETLMTATATVQGDIYQAGILLYRAANGDPCYDEQHGGLSPDKLQQRIVSGRFPHRRIFLPHVPRRLRTVIRKALQVDPAERFRSATEFADALGRVPITLDWLATGLNGGGFSWSARRLGSRNLEVQLLPEGGGQWRVQVFTVGDGKRRAKGLDHFWREGMPYEAAADHLTTVFSLLS